MRARWAATGLVALLLAGCSDGLPDLPDVEPGASRAAESATSSAYSPPEPCLLRVGSRRVPLGEGEAVRLTGLAADVTRSGGGVRALAGRLSDLEAPRATARALLGHDGPALTCAYLRADLRDQKSGPQGLTPRAQALRATMQRAFGPLPMGGFAAGGISTGHVDGSAHYEGRALDVFFRPHEERANQRRGWTVSQWIVARGNRLRVLSVIYRDHIWTVWASYAGWRDYVHPSGNRTNPVLRHLDHVHTAVLGGPYRG